MSVNARPSVRTSSGPAIGTGAYGWPAKRAAANAAEAPAQDAVMPKKVAVGGADEWEEF